MNHLKFGTAHGNSALLPDPGHVSAATKTSRGAGAGPSADAGTQRPDGAGAEAGCQPPGSDRDPPPHVTTAVERQALEHARRGDAHRDRREWREAASAYGEALRLDWRLNWARVQMAHAVKEAGDPAGAVPLYRRALELAPDDADIWLNLGHALKLAGSLGQARNAAGAARHRHEAVEAYRKALELDASLSPIWVQLGHELKERGDTQGAIDAYTRAVEAAPGDFDPHFQLAHALKSAGDMSGAIAAFRQAAAIDAGHEEVEREIAGLSAFEPFPLAEMLGGAPERRLGHRTPLLPGLRLELFPAGARGQARPVAAALASGTRPGLLLDAAAATEGARLVLQPPEGEVPLLLDVIFRVPGAVTPRATLGDGPAAEAPEPDAAGRRRLFALWPGGGPRAEFALELPEGGALELAWMRLSPLPGAASRLPATPTLRWADAPAAARPEPSVLPLGASANGLRRFLVLGAGRLGSSEVAVTASTAEGATGCWFRSEALEGGARWLEVAPPRSGAVLEMQGATQDGLPLHLESIPTLDAMTRATHRDGVLRAEARLDAAVAPPGTVVELQAGGLGLFRSVLQPDPLMPGASRVLMEVRVSRRTAAMGLAILLPGLGICLPCPLQEREREPARLSPPRVEQAGLVTMTMDGLGIDRSGRRFLYGWARDSDVPEAAVVLDCFADGLLLGSTVADGMRADVASRLGGSPICGFRAEIPSNFAPGRDVTFSGIPRAVDVQVRNPGRRERLPPYGAPLPATPPTPRLPPAPSEPAIVAAPSVAAIILNQDGGALLDALLGSIWRHDPEGFRRIVIIDHASEDDSEAVAARHAAVLPITFLKRARDASFSESNNAGAALCDEEVLLFINNDIVLTQPLAAPMTQALVPGVGVAGLRLMDPAVPGSSVALQAQQHLGVHFEPLSGSAIQPLETRYLTEVPGSDTRRIATPATTAACVAMRRDIFEALGGFDEEYFYGWEDTDLCLKALAAGHTVVTLNDLSAVHVRGASRRLMPAAQLVRREQNEPTFRTRWTYALRRAIAQAGPEGHGFWTGRRMAVGFVVSEAGEDAVAGDYMTALELAQALSEAAPIQCFFYVKARPVDALGLDMLIVMTDDFDVRAVVNLATTCLLVAWPRNWFHRWVAQPWREHFSLWFAASERACDYLRAELGRRVGLLRIATNPARFVPGPAVPSLRCEVAFTGNNWGSPRDIMDLLPRVADLEIRLVGKGWDMDARTAPLDAGFLPYNRLPEVYRSSGVVIDDSNFATAAWGSLNSRVFDALATGTLVVTNNVVGVAEVFPGLLPTWTDAASLEAALRDALSDPARRRHLTEEARTKVLARHTYAVRAREMLTYIAARTREGLRVAIKIGVPSLDRAEGWGDWYFAHSLRRELEDLGHNVRIDCLDSWNGAHAHGDDAVIAIRGLSRYRPQKGQINLLWVISHPDMVSAEELSEYDHVFAASEIFVRHFDGFVDRPIEFMPQCTDPRIFHPGAGDTTRGRDLVFVGNSRRVRRPVVAGAVASSLPLRVYGQDWCGVVPDAALLDGTVPNEGVGDLYRGAGAVLNDHWEDMRRWGFVSNRLFDAVACGVPVVSDALEGLNALTGGVVHSFATEEELPALLAAVLRDPPRATELRRAAEAVIAEHSFARRAGRFDAVLRAEDAARARLAPGHAA